MPCRAAVIQRLAILAFHAALSLSPGSTNNYFWTAIWWKSHGEISHLLAPSDLKQKGECSLTRSVFF